VSAHEKARSGSGPFRASAWRRSETGGAKIFRFPAGRRPLTTELERLEVKFALADAASPEDLDLYQRTANSLRRLLEAVGLNRRPKDVTPDPLAYAREVNIDESAP
jgi:hypothetical protein